MTGPPRARRAGRLAVRFTSAGRVHHHGLVSELVGRARHAGLAGATVLEEEAAPGPSGGSHRHHERHFVLLVVDDEEKVRAFAGSLDDLEGVEVRIDPVTAWRAEGR